jgi:hypothetical protein
VGTSATQGLTAKDLAYRARALGQAHPMTPLAKRFTDEAIAEQRRSQPMAEIGMWAGAAMLGGYCVRRVEESEAGFEAPVPQDIELSELDREVTRVADELRDGGPVPFLLGDADLVVETLDRIVASEVHRRLDNLEDNVDEGAWSELEEYLAWWVVRGYALRVAETHVA